MTQQNNGQRLGRLTIGALILGVLVAMILANVGPELYQEIKHHALAHDWPIGHVHEGHTVITLEYVVKEMVMAFFFLYAGIEVYQAIALPRGALRGKQALTPVVATIGGMAGPAMVYLALAYYFLDQATFTIVANGWAIPTATDIAFSLIVGRIVFGPAHPAVAFLLLLAILDDAGGLIILALFYPIGELALSWLLLSFGVAGLTYSLCIAWPRRSTRARAIVTRLRLWPYAVAGAVCWFGFAKSGIHPALGLLPLIPAIPNAGTDLGVYTEKEDARSDPLNQIAHGIKLIMPLILVLFGFVSAGVSLGAMSGVTFLVLFGLMIGKPVGIFAFGYVASLIWGLPSGMRRRDLLVLGLVAAIGFTVALFVAGVAFKDLPVEQAAAKMGALLSLLSGALAIGFGRLMWIERKFE